jgi:hypothetical protein
MPPYIDTRRPGGMRHPECLAASSIVTGHQQPDPRVGRPGRESNIPVSARSQGESVIVPRGLRAPSARRGARLRNPLALVRRVAQFRFGGTPFLATRHRCLLSRAEHAQSLPVRPKEHQPRVPAQTRRAGYRADTNLEACGLGRSHRLLQTVSDRRLEGIVESPCLALPMGVRSDNGVWRPKTSKSLSQWSRIEEVRTAPAVMGKSMSFLTVSPCRRHERYSAVASS